VSEESVSVRDTKVTVAGAGVAIFDSRDGLILEVRKNLEARKNLETLVDVQMVTYEIAELEALIEGLNEALRLDLKRLTFLCESLQLQLVFAFLKSLHDLICICLYLFLF
jgi:hypothetical protein